MAENDKQVWTCEHCKKTYKDPDNTVRYFHTCRQSNWYWFNALGEQG